MVLTTSTMFFSAHYILLISKANAKQLRDMYFEDALHISKEVFYSHC